jgi:hypothetical protein
MSQANVQQYRIMDSNLGPEIKYTRAFLKCVILDVASFQNHKTPVTSKSTKMEHQ